MATPANVPVIASGHKRAVSIVLIVAATYWGEGFSKALCPTCRYLLLGRPFGGWQVSRL